MTAKEIFIPDVRDRYTYWGMLLGGTLAANILVGLSLVFIFYFVGRIIDLLAALWKIQKSKEAGKL